MTHYLLLILSTALVNNVVLVKFLGLGRIPLNNIGITNIDGFCSKIRERIS